MVTLDLKMSGLAKDVAATAMNKTYLSTFIITVTAVLKMIYPCNNCQSYSM
jgi:hypothetical protein